MIKGKWIAGEQQNDPMSNMVRSGVSFIVLLLALLFILTGCRRENEEAGESEAAKGRYMETELTVPEEAEDQVMNIDSLEDGRLRLLTHEEAYDSDDGGTTWKKEENLTRLIQEIASEEGYFECMEISSKGELVLGYYAETEAAATYYYVSAGGEYEVMDLILPELEAGEYDDVDEETGFQDNGIQSVQFLDEDYLLAYNGTNGIYYINMNTGKVEQQFGDNTLNMELNGYICLEDTLIINFQEGMEMYDVKTRRKLELDEALSDYFLASSYQDAGRYNKTVFAPSITEGTFYFADDTGVYRYTKGASQVEMIINGDLNSVSNPAYWFFKLIVKSEESFLLYAYNDNYEETFLNYEYSAEANVVPDKELTIYSLYHQNYVKQLIANFQAEHSDYYVMYEIGIEEESGLSKEDAIAILNTRILAGDGPDILILDQLPVNALIEKEVLYDISPAVGKAAAKEEMFENILYFDQQENGKMYQVPISFTVPVIAGEADAASNVHNMDDLEEVVQKYRDRYPDAVSILREYYMPEDFVYEMIYTSEALFVDEAGSIDENRLKLFIDTIARIYELNGGLADADIRQLDEDEVGEYSTMPICNDDAKILNNWKYMDIGEIDGLYTIGQMVSICDLTEWQYEPFSGQNSSVFSVGGCIGINAKSEKIDGAEAFLAYVLSDKIQGKESVYSSGLPVNKGAWVTMYEKEAKNALEGGRAGSAEYDEDGNVLLEIEYNTRGTTLEEFEALTEMFESLETCAMTDPVMTHELIVGISRYLTGEKKMDETVAEIIQKQELRLSE